MDISFKKSENLSVKIEKFLEIKDFVISWSFTNS